MNTEAEIKARELVDKYQEMLKLYTTHVYKEIPEKCALIAVDEILKIASSVKHYSDMQVTEYGFWKQVLEKIKTL